MAQRRERDRAETSVRAVLGQPLRIRLVAACSRRERTLAELAERFGISPRTTSSYLRQLVAAEYLHVRVENVRGVRKFFFTAAQRALVEDEEFARMTLKQRHQSSEEVIRDLVRHMWGSWKAGTLDERADSHLTWNQMQLDEEGWEELIGVLRLTYDTAIDIEAAALDRLQRSGGRAIPTVIALGGFESPRSRRPEAK